MQTVKATSPRARKSTAQAAVQAEQGGAASATTAPAEEQRRQAICQTAYGLYQARGCVYGHALEDWLAAEAQVDQALAAALAGPTTAATDH